MGPGTSPCRDSLTRAVRSLVLTFALVVIATAICGLENTGAEPWQFVEFEGACGEQADPDAVCGRYETPPAAPAWHVYSERSDSYEQEVDLVWNEDAFWELSILGPYSFWWLLVRSGHF